MEHCSSFESLYLYFKEIYEKKQQNDDYTDLPLSTIQNYVNPQFDNNKYEIRLYNTILWILENGKKKGDFILFIRYIESTIEKYGCLFGNEGDDVNLEWNVFDGTLFVFLFLYKYCNTISQKLCCIKLFRSFYQHGYYLHLHSFSFSIMSDFLLTTIKEEECNDDFLLFVSEWFSTVCELPQFPNWQALQDFFSLSLTQLSNTNIWKAIDSFIKNLPTSCSFCKSLFSSVILPLLEIPSIGRILESSPHVLNLIRILIQKISPSIGKDFFNLWSDCLSHCFSLYSSFTIDDLENITHFLLSSIQQDSLTIPQLNKCLLILINCFEIINQQSNSLSSHVLQTICSLFFKPSYQFNKTVISRCLSILSLLSSQQQEFSSDQFDLLIESVLFIDSKWIQQDLDEAKVWNEQGIRKDCLEFLLKIPFSFQFVVEWLFVPIVNYSSLWNHQSDLHQIFIHSLSNTTQILFSSDPLILQVIFTILNTYKSSILIHSAFDSASKDFLSLITTPSLNEQTLSSLLSSHQIHYLNLLSSSSFDNTSWLISYLSDLLRVNSTYLLSGDLTHGLSLVCSLPYSSLQEALIEHSCLLQNDEEIVLLLKLLVVVNEVSYSTFHQLAQQQAKENQLNEEQISEIERNLSDDYYQSGILSCYLSFIKSLFESLEDTNCSSIQIECILTLLIIIKQIFQHHSTKRDDWIAYLYTLLSFHSNSYLTTIIPMIYTILFTYTNDELSLQSYLNKTIEYCCIHNHKQTIQTLLNLVIQNVMSNNLLDCYLNCFFLVCMYNGISQQEKENYFLLFLQTNAKGNRDEFIVELFANWRNMESNGDDDRKACLLLEFANLLTKHLPCFKIDKIQQVLDDSCPKKKRGKKRISSDTVH